MNATMARSRRAVEGVLLNIIMYVALFIFLFPVLWMVMTSLKTPLAAQAMPPVWFFRPVLENYISVFTSRDTTLNFGKLLLNSVIVSVSSTVLSVGCGTLASYATSRFKSKGSKTIAMAILSTRMFPPAATLIPIFMMMQWLHLMDTYVALVLCYTAFSLSFVVLMLKGFFDEIPKDIEESAMIDGCSWFTAFFKIVLPLIAPGLAATAIMCMMFSWNEFMFALVLTRHNAVTAPIIANSYITMFGVKWGELTASSTTLTLPMLIFAFLVRRHIVKGLTFGSVK